MSLYPNGLGENGVGDVLASAAPIQCGPANIIWWVSSTSPNALDAASPRGSDREEPLATLAQAIVNATAGDIIVLEAGHVETRTTPLVLNKVLTVVGIGLIGGKPAAQLKINAAAQSLLSVSSAVELRNIYFPANMQSNSANKISMSAAAAGSKIVGCHMECSSFDAAAGVFYANNMHDVLIENTTFISTATSGTRPGYAVRLGTGIEVFETNGLVISDGTYGFGSGVTCNGSVASIRCLNTSLLLGAKMNLQGKGWVHVGASSGLAQVNWS